MSDLDYSTGSALASFYLHSMRKLRLRDVNFLCPPYKEGPDTNSSVPCPSQTGDGVLTVKRHTLHQDSLRGVCLEVCVGYLGREME